MLSILNYSCPVISTCFDDEVGCSVSIYMQPPLRIEVSSKVLEVQKNVVIRLSHDQQMFLV